MNSSGCAVSLMSQRDVGNFTQNVASISLYLNPDWLSLPFHPEMRMFLLPTAVCFVAAIFMTPPILFSIFSNFSLRQETRFLLLGNALLSDLIYLLLYTISSICNMSNIYIPKYMCALLLFSLAVTYGGGVLTAGGMVVDTYLAILWPLHYMILLPPSRTRKLIVLLWFSSCLFAGVLFLVLYFTQKPVPCQYDLCSLPVILLITLHGDQAIRLCHILFIIGFLLCFSMILCCYIFLCYKTRESGMWKGVSSRASVTFLMHHIILGFYFCPLLLLLAESLLYINKVISLDIGMLITMTICNVLIVLPKGVSPFLYGFRYREIYKSLRLFCKFRRHGLVAPANRYT
ncbi:probable G-protein coupled receptor 148 [Phyllobates terribilis]|uniref:probable G-protein coupled receptor 148 n=1 Tax=Phyllobates terribilis TaxID=111132 RepID=UPI003CCA6F15